MGDHIALDSVIAQFGDLSRAMSDEELSPLWAAAVDVTSCVAEQAWLVAMCIQAGKDAHWLSLHMDEEPRELGIFESDL